MVLCFWSGFLGVDPGGFRHLDSGPGFRKVDPEGDSLDSAGIQQESAVVGSSKSCFIDRNGAQAGQVDSGWLLR